MAFFKTDKSKAGGFAPVSPGQYECVISKVELTKSQKGADMIKLELTIRNGVDQEFKGRKLFDNLLFMDTTMFRIHNIMDALEGDEFESLQDIVKFLRNKFVRCVVVNKNETYQGETTLRDRISSYKKTQHPGGGEEGENAFDEGIDDAGHEVNDDDLPF